MTSRVTQLGSPLPAPLGFQLAGPRMGYGSYKPKVTKQEGQGLRDWGDDSGDEQKVKRKRSGFKPQHPRESFGLQSMRVEWCGQGRGRRRRLAG